MGLNVKQTSDAEDKAMSFLSFFLLIHSPPSLPPLPPLPRLPLSHSPTALMIWCGNNEGYIDLTRMSNNLTQPVFTADYTVLFDEGVRMTLWQESPASNFFASSPSNDASVDRPDLGIYAHRTGDDFDGRQVGGTG